jgi:hypothetical protein
MSDQTELSHNPQLIDKFPEPNTIPDGWDLSEIMKTRSSEVNCPDDEHLIEKDGSS